MTHTRFESRPFAFGNEESLPKSAPRLVLSVDLRLSRPVCSNRIILSPRIALSVVNLDKHRLTSSSHGGLHNFLRSKVSRFASFLAVFIQILNFKIAGDFKCRCMCVRWTFFGVFSVLKSVLSFF